MDIEKLTEILASNSWRVIAAILGAVAAQITKSIVEQIKGSAKENRKDISKFTLAKEIEYQNTTGVENLRNSLAFTALTQRTAPIHIINLVMNCYDPGEAIYIYSKTPGYIKFNPKKSDLGHELEKPKSIDAAVTAQYIVAFLSILTLVLCLLGIRHFFKFLDPNIIKAVIKLPNSEVLSVFIALMAFVFSFLVWHSFWLLKISTQDIQFTKRVKRFYRGYDLYKKANE
ncbi:hypothetical protein C1752_11495 [Acaryochloris thomasi RCC1774]|uniref:Uncharacterized protein n=1 Tax=Acaryochloris thomasi RCC1774 TaxID=1764569 RepID=A0A2W1J7Q1_9CYAN|nr:hypothetical protein [Acaryochloris thomasi]PZD70493.1 hypothetical protein C1752_11495 [Acaryochloris thomasi RCC1774]